MDFELTASFNSKDVRIRNLKSALLQTNEKSSQYGLRLSEKETDMLIQQGIEVMDAQDRIEFGKSATVKMIENFMKSSYISQNNYAQSIAALLEVFYEAKEESLDILTDDEVIDILYDFFEQESGGDIEMLQSRDMYYLCRTIRNIANGIQGDAAVSEEDSDV